MCCDWEGGGGMGERRKTWKKWSHSPLSFAPKDPPAPQYNHTLTAIGETECLCGGVLFRKVKEGPRKRRHWLWWFQSSVIIWAFYGYFSQGY